MEIKIDPKIEKLLPPLEGEEYEQLAEDIAQRGVQVPIVVDQDGYIIDGHTRYRIATGLRIEVLVCFTTFLAGTKVTFCSLIVQETRLG